MPETEPELPLSTRYEASEQPYSLSLRVSRNRRLYISAAGGSGGFATNSGAAESGAPGRGGRMSGVVNVNPDDVLTINVGKGANGNQPGIGVRFGGKGGDRGQGGGGSNGGAGGAASGVWRGADALVVAGGGGGAGGAGNGTVAGGGNGGNGGHGGRAPENNGTAGGYGARGMHAGDGAKGGIGGVLPLGENGGAEGSGNGTAGGGGGGGGGYNSGKGGDGYRNPDGFKAVDGGGGGGGGSNFIVKGATSVSTGTTIYVDRQSSDGFVAVNSVENCVKIRWGQADSVVAVANQSQLQGAPIYLWQDQRDDASQQWHLIWSLDHPDQCRIVSLLSGRILGCASGDRGAHIVQLGLGQPGNIWWRHEWVDRPNRTCKLVSLLSGLALAVDTKVGIRHGSPLIQLPYENAPDFHWKLAPLNL